MKEFGLNSLKAGDVVARRYVILRQLREEPCGWVWLAQDRSLGLDVGFKFIPREWPGFDAAKKALRREGALALKLRHPYILSVLHYEEAEAGVYLIQEPYPGESLLSHLTRLERFRMPVALSLLEQVAQALAFAHEQNEVHHSLDPSHVLIANNTVKVANFSCPPEEVEEDERVAHLELKAYTAPEVLQGEPVTSAANVFSLGVMGFRLTAGSLPYPLTFDEPFPYRLESMPADLEEIPLPLQNLLLQCLAPEPGERFEDAGAFVAALEQRRELWRTPASDRWFGWTPEKRQAATGAATRVLGRLWEGSKGMAGKIGEGVENLKAQREPGVVRRWLLGLAAFALFLVVLVWGGRAIFQRVETSTEPAPPPKSEVKLPPAGGPPLNAVTQPAPPTRPAAPATRVVSPATGPAFKAPVREDRYQLLVATYATYDQARTLKDRIRAKKLPATVYRVKSKKKTYFIVKAGPFSGKKRAEDAARRLKKEERLPNTPKLVKIKATTVKPAPRKPR